MSSQSFIQLTNPYGGTGLRARSAEQARARIDNVLAQRGADVVLTECALEILDPCSKALAEHILREPVGSTAVRGCSDTQHMDLSADELARAYGHTLCPVAAAAWERFGVPNQVGFWAIGSNAHLGNAGAAPEDRYAVTWGWSCERGERTTALRESWFAFVAEHQRLYFGELLFQVRLRESWELRLRDPATGASAPDTYPLSSLMCHYEGRHSSAFLGFVFPYSEPCTHFAQSWEAVCEALGMRLSPGLLRRVRIKSDGGWVFRKIDFDPKDYGTDNPSVDPPEGAVVLADAAAVAALTQALRALGDKKTKKKALESAHEATAGEDPTRLIQFGLPLLPKATGEHLYALLTRSFAALTPEQVESVRDAVLALWRGKDRRANFWSSLVDLFGPLVARDPICERELLATLFGPDKVVPLHKRSAAVALLGRGGTELALRALITRARMDRGRFGAGTMSAIGLIKFFRGDAASAYPGAEDPAKWRESVVHSLGEIGRPEAWSTLLLELVAPDAVSDWVLWTAMGRVDAKGSIPLLRRLAAAGDVQNVMATLWLTDCPESTDWLRELTLHPNGSVRLSAVEELVKRVGDEALPLLVAAGRSIEQAEVVPGYCSLWSIPHRLVEASGNSVRVLEVLSQEEYLVQVGLVPVTLPPLPTALEGCTSPWGAIRDASRVHLRTVADPTTLLAMALAELLDMELAKRGYRRRRELVHWASPPEGFSGFRSNMERVDWVLANSEKLAPQRLTPELEELRTLGVEAFAERYPRGGIFLENDELVAADALEQALVLSPDEVAAFTAKRASAKVPRA